MARRRSALELKMLNQLKEAGLTEGMVEELVFHPDRRWRFDFAWPEKMVALEVQGGIFSRGRHARPRGILQDYEKFSEAAIAGWRVLLVTGVEVSNGEAVDRASRMLLGDDPPCGRCLDWELDE